MIYFPKFKIREEIMLNQNKILEEKVIFLGIINNLDEYISINKSFPFEEITVSEEIE